MAISQEEIEKLARLARLSFTEEERERFTGEFDEIIAFADTINASVSGDTSAIRNISKDEVDYLTLRADEVVQSLPNEKILSNVEGKDGFFAVKKANV